MAQQSEGVKVYSARSRRQVQLVVGMGSAIAPFLVGSMIVAAPTIGREFGANVPLLGWLTAAFFLFAAASLVPFGRIADIKGAKRVFGAGMLTYIVSAVLSAVAPDMFILIAGRALTGIGAGMVFGTSIALLGLVFPAQTRGKAIGINVTAMFLGFVLGNLAGGLFSFYIGWRSLFLVVLVLAALVYVVLVTRIRGECELLRVKNYDMPGMALYAAALVLAFYGLSSIGGGLGLVSLFAGGVFAAAFVGWERRHPYPLLIRTVSGNRDFVLASIANLTLQGALFSVPFILSLQFQYVSGLDARITGLLLIIPQTLTVVLSPIGGSLADRTSPRLVAGIGCLVGASSLMLLTAVGQESSVLVPVAVLALGGIGIALFMPSVVYWALSHVPRSEFGVASSFTETTRLAGMALSNSIVILVFGLILGANPVDLAHVPEFMSAVRASAIVFLVLCVFAAAIAISSIRAGRKA